MWERCVRARCVCVCVREREREREREGERERVVREFKRVREHPHADREQARVLARRQVHSYAQHTRTGCIKPKGKKQK